jgi:hypothetical protein
MKQNMIQMLLAALLKGGGSNFFAEGANATGGSMSTNPVGGEADPGSDTPLQTPAPPRGYEHQWQAPYLLGRAGPDLESQLFAPQERVPLDVDAGAGHPGHPGIEDSGTIPHGTPAPYSGGPVQEVPFDPVPGVPVPKPVPGEGSKMQQRVTAAGDENARAFANWIQNLFSGTGAAYANPQPGQYEGSPAWEQRILGNAPPVAAHSHPPAPQGHDPSRQIAAQFSPRQGGF